MIPVPHRRLVTVPGVAMLAGGLTAFAPAWIPAALAHDLARAPRRLPLSRMLSFGLVWSWLETVGVVASTSLWAAGQSSRADAHYGLQRWWASRLVDGLRLLCDLRIEVDGLELLAPGPVVMCGRHASIPDSLLPAWLLGQAGGMRPRYVLTRELLADPCLDIVGNRLPNHFVDRNAADAAPELDAIERLARGMGSRDAGVIFPEGAVANAPRRRRALAKLAEQDPARGRRLAGLRHLLPPRPRGTEALLRGAPDAAVVFMAHVGLEGLDRLAGAPAHLPLPAPVRVHLRRFARAEVPAGADFPAWLDDRWLEMDAWVETHS
ncbi:MAG TPA: 1-acyl-sn-glycerol-3-phosphate acyltransferase [Acidimicrobiia bacterium]